ncbi:alpha/beta fold hydrolase [Enterobacter hormaechei]
MFNKLAYSAVALTVSLGTVMSCQAEATGKDYASAFNQVKQINAGDLNVGYVDIGPKEGQPVILLHGWPYDIHSYAEVAPALAAKGYRVIVPSLRGYGTTRFISDKTPRNGQPSAMAKDIVNLMDALNIKQAVFAGYDWGARTADIVAALWPERVKSLVSVSGYLISSQAIGKQPLPPKAEVQWWYQFYFATPRGAEGYAKNTHDFARLIWSRLRLTGNSAMPPSMPAPNPSITRTTLPSRSVITAGVWGWRRVSRNMTPTNKSWLRCRILRCRPSPSRAVTTEHHILYPQPMQGNSPENMSTVLSAQRLATTRRRKIRRTLLKPLSTRISSDMCYFQSVTS